MRVINFLFAKNHKQHSGLKKTVGVLLLCVTLISTWSFPKKAEAAQSTFGNQNQITVQLPAVSQTAIFSDGAQINGTIVVNVPSVDADGDGSIGVNDTDEQKSWSIIEMSSEATQADGFTLTAGIFLMIKPDTSNTIVSGSLLDLTPKMTLATNTFTKQVSGLSPDTVYYARIVAPKAGNATNYYISDYVTFKTKNDGSTVSSIENQNDSSSQNGNKIPEGVPPCGFGVDLLGGSDSSMMGCLAVIVYYALYMPSSWLAMLGGYFLDFFMGYSISSGAYTASSFPEEGWGMLRDLANICFIFLLVYAGIRLILDIGKFDAKKTITHVLIMAILINFSLFFTKVIIDAGNITARIFYNALEVKNKADGTPNVGIASEKAISVTLIDQVDPQKIMAAAGEDASDIQTSDSSPEPEAYAGYFILITLVAAAVNIYFMFVFFSVGFLFVGRTLQLWVSMITAPIACISYASGAGYHDGWWKDLWKSAFVAPIVLFFLYLIASFLKAGLVTGLFSKYNDKGFISILMAVAVPFVLLVGLMKIAKEKATEYSSDIGKKAASALGSVGKVAGGLALGAATGGASFALSRTVGAGSKVLQSGGVQKKLREVEARGGISGKFAKFTANTIDSGAKGTFDIRNTTVGGTLLKKTGLNTDNKMLNYVGLNSDARKGGYEQMVKDKEKEKQEKVNKSAKSFASSFNKDEDVEAYYYKKHKGFVDERNKREESAWLAANPLKTTADWNAAKKDDAYIAKYRTPAGADAATFLKIDEPKVPTTKREASAEFKKTYAESIKEKNNLSADPRKWTRKSNPLTRSIDPLERTTNTTASKKITESAEKELEAENRFVAKKEDLKAKKKLAEQKKIDPTAFERETEKVEEDIRTLDHEINEFKNQIKSLTAEIPKIQSQLNADKAGFATKTKANPVTGEMEEYPDFAQKIGPGGTTIPSGLSAGEVATKEGVHDLYLTDITNKRVERSTTSKKRDLATKKQYEKKDEVKGRVGLDKDIEELDKKIKEGEDRRKAADEKK